MHMGRVIGCFKAHYLCNKVTSPIPNTLKGKWKPGPYDCPHQVNSVKMILLIVAHNILKSYFPLSSVFGLPWVSNLMDLYKLGLGCD